MSARFCGFLSVAALLALTLAGCVRPGGRVAQGNHDQVLYWGNGAEPADLDPQTDIGEPDSRILYALFEGLVTQDAHDLHPIPGVAESWDVSPDGRTYTFHLRHNAKWSNGDPVTSRDFIDSYHRMLSPRLSAQYAEYFWKDGAVVNAREYYDGKITDFAQVGFRAPDPYTFVIQLVNPTAYFLSLLANPPWMPVHLPTILKYGAYDEKGTRWTHPGNFVGNGPFNLDTWRTEQEIVVSRARPTGTPPTSGSTPSTSTRPKTPTARNAISAPACCTSPPTCPRRRSRPIASIFPRCSRTRPTSAPITTSSTSPTPRSRTRACAGRSPWPSTATASSRMSRAAGRCPRTSSRRPAPTATPTRAGCPPITTRRANSSPKPASPMARECRSVDILINSSGNHRPIAEVIQQTWRKELHVDARITNQEFKVYLDSEHTLDYQVGRSAWIGDYPDPFTFLGIFVTGGGNNNTGFANPEYDRLMARSMADAPAERLADFQQAETILLDEAIVAPIYFYTNVYLLQPSVKGWYSNILNRHMPKFLYLEETAPVDLKKLPPDGGEPHGADTQQ